MTKILDDYFDLELRKKIKNSEDWFRNVESRVRYFEESSNSKKGYFLERVGKTWLQKATFFATFNNVKTHLTLDITFRYQEGKFAYCPENFSGLNIWAGHSGSEGLVDLIEFKPEMDAYLHAIGIDYEDRSKLNL